MRKLAAILFAGVLLYGSNAAYQAYRGPAIDLARALTNTGAVLLEATVDAWCEISLPVNSAEDAGRLLARALKAMGADEGVPIQLENMDGAEEFGQIAMREARAETELAGGIALLASVQSTENTDRQDTYLMLSLFDQTESPNLSLMYELLLKGAASLGAHPEHATQLVAVLKGKLTPQGVADMVSAILRDTEAELKNIYQTGALVSVSGYSAPLDTHIHGKGLPNINLAFRYNAEEGNTWIYLGSPSIWEPM